MVDPRPVRCVRLVVFDLDQTLVDVTWLHDRTVHRLLGDFFGVDAWLGEIHFGGKSLGENITELAVLKGVPREAVTQRLDEILDAYDVLFRSGLPDDASSCVLPGARRLLDELSKTEHVVALHTGSSEGVAEKVLASTGLAGYFRFAVFGTRSRSRARMLKMVLKRAEELTGRRFRGNEMVIIGDSVRDVECSHLFGAVGIAVATGSYSREDLAKRTPDYLFDSLEDHREIMRAIESGCSARPALPRGLRTPSSGRGYPASSWPGTR